MPRVLDYPPVWLIGMLMLAWGQGVLFPVGTAGAFHWPGTAVAVVGLVLMALAVPEFLRRRTTIVPHRAPAALITTGIYRVSRNPIYLGDALVLLGLILRWGAWPSLVLVPVFVAVITQRFILGEEARLRAAFGADYEAYTKRTRRWL